MVFSLKSCELSRIEASLPLLAAAAVCFTRGQLQACNALFVLHLANYLLIIRVDFIRDGD